VGQALVGGHAMDAVTGSVMPGFSLRLASENV
jgi:hypothetical protein